MFSRRKRSSSHHQPLPTPAAQSAQSAASHAFLKSQPSSSSLSSAAAAAALRNLSPTPTPVENVQTKRMVQRRSSTQSQASPLTTRRSASVSGTLRRSNSSSSMTARTFRDPSPHRPVTSSGPTSSHNPGFVDVPPLPSLPSHYAPRTLPARRTMSVDTSTRSPPSSPRSATRKVNGEREREGAVGVQSTPHNRMSSLSTVPEAERPASRSSVNFSYPLGSRPTSPALAENRPLSLGASAAREVLSADAISIKQPIVDKSATAKPKAHTLVNAEGNTGRAGGFRAATAIAAAQAVSSQKSTPQSDLSPARDGRQGHAPWVAKESNLHVDRAPPTVVAQPEVEHPSSRVVPERWPATVPEEIEPDDDAGNVASPAAQSGNRFTSASPTIDHIEPVSTPPQSPSSVEKENTPQQTHLRESSSPGRSTRFARWLSVNTAGDQVHQPPPRSVSPVKSALKIPRGNSLSPDGRSGFPARGGLTLGEISDGTSIASDEGSRIEVKKRPVKVSFDDEAEVVGVAASPPTSPEEYVPESPPSKSKSRMSWLGVGKKKQPVFDSVTSNYDFDEVMKPRPVLPSFGSVRGNREGALQNAPVPQFSDNDSTTSSDESSVPELSFSNDHAFGGLLPKPQQELSHAHNIKSVEQLSVNGEASVAHQHPASSMKMNGAHVSITGRPPYNKQDLGPRVPSIAVEPATPPVDNEKVSMDLHRSSLDQYQVPGGFPPSNSDRSLKNKADLATRPVSNAIPTVDDIDTEGESGDSVYSDAAEDFDGDGFGSINAIVDSRSIPRSAPASGTVSQSRDTTPRPIDRVAAVDCQPGEVPEAGLESVRSTTPTQESVNRQAEDSPTSPSHDRGFGGPYPPLPVKSKARNGASQSAPSKQRPMSVHAHGLSSSQDPRQLKTASNGAGNGKVRPVSLGPSMQRNGGQGFTAGFPGGLRRTKSNDSDSSSSFKRASPSTRGGGPHAMRRTLRASPTQGWVQTYSDRTDSPIEHRPLSSGSSTGTMRKTLRNAGTGNDRLSFFSTNKTAQRARFTKSPPKPMQSSSRFADSDDEHAQSGPQPFRSRFADSSDEEEPSSNHMRPVRGIPRRQGAHDGDSTELDDSSAEEGRQRRAKAAAAAQPDPTPPGSRDRDVSGMSGMAAVARQRGMSQRELEQFLMQPPRGRKPSILNRLGLKKSRNSDHRIRKADVESPSRSDTPLERSRLDREQVRNEPFVDDPLGTTVTTVSAAPPASPPSSKLVKKNTKRQTTASESWPLQVNNARTQTPEPVTEKNDSNSTSPFSTEKPALTINHTGRSSVVVNGANEEPAVKASVTPEADRTGPVLNDDKSDTTIPDDHGPSARDVVISGSGRKKRFPLLRKAFGLKS